MSGFLSPGFSNKSPGFGIFINVGIFIPKIRNFFGIFRGMRYPDKSPSLLRYHRKKYVDFLKNFDNAVYYEFNYGLA